MNKLNIGWLYPKYMSTYGDRGNILILTQRAKLRDIKIDLIKIESETDKSELDKVDLFFAGGAQDTQQELVLNDLKKGKDKVIMQKIEDSIPALFVCGAPQIMGKVDEINKNKKLIGLGVFDIETIAGDPTDRLIGNMLSSINWQYLEESEDFISNKDYKNMTGFENHSGRSYLKGHTKPLATIISGNGNNGKDKTEGMVYKNAIGTYSHGPLLSKNPHIADWLIECSLRVKYNKKIKLNKIDDTLEWEAHKFISKKLNI